MPGLTAFLTDEHFKRVGVFTKYPQELFRFWKGAVSLTYSKFHQMKRLIQVGLTFQEETTTMLNNSSVKKYSPTGKHKEEKKEVNEKSIFYKYQLYEKLYEMDVVYTL